MNRRLLLGLTTALMATSALRWARAQTPPTFSPEQLDQMLAPVALYPDALLSQVLMASTYPLEVVEAARWTRDNPNLHGNDAVNAVANLDWDVSVKSLVAFPQVLGQMDSHLDWTQKLGDAELGQPQDVADSIQRLRAQAAAAGNLQSGPQYVVSTEGAGDDVQYIIAPANPALIYVPFYNPLWVYGRWRWAGYPPYYWQPLPAWGYGPVLAAGFMWGVGLGVGVALFGGWTWRRGHSFINVNAERAVAIDRHFDRARYTSNVWSHDPDHRRGVAYRTPQQAEQFHQPARGGVDQRQPFRGHTVEQTDRVGTQPQVNAPPKGNATPQIVNRGASTNIGTSHPTTTTNTLTNVPAAKGPTLPRPQVLNEAAHTVPGSQNTNALSGVSRGPAVVLESQRGQQQQQRLVQHTPPSAPPPPRPAPPPPRPAAPQPINRK
jgi:hypothetical protein